MRRGSGAGAGALRAAALLFVALHAQSTFASEDTEKSVSKRSFSDIDTFTVGTTSEATTDYEGLITERSIQNIPIISDIKSSLRMPSTSSEGSNENNGVLLTNENDRSGATEAAWDFGALPYGTGYIAGPPPITSVQTKADATIQLLTSGSDPYGLGSNEPEYNFGKLQALLQALNPMNAAQAVGAGGLPYRPGYDPSQAQAVAQTGYNVGSIPPTTGNMRAQYLDASQSSRLIPRNELIFLQNIPGAENLVRCSKEAEFHHVVISSKQCLVCACIRTGFMLRATCASCAGCARVQSPRLYGNRPTDQYLPQLQLQTKPDTWPATPYQQPVPEYPRPLSEYPQPISGYSQPIPEYPQSIPGYPSSVPGYSQPIPGYPSSVPGYPQSIPGYPSSVPGYPQSIPGYPRPIQEYHRPTPGYRRPKPGAPACAPLPTGTPFEHPLNPCQVCICDVSIFNNSDTSIACLENPQCVTPADIPSLPSTPHHTVPVPTPLCQMFPKNVFFPHPSDKCKQCKCFEEISSFGISELKILCIPEQNCGFASILPFLPSILPSESYLPQTMPAALDSAAGVQLPKNIIQPGLPPKIRDVLPYLSEPGKYPLSPDLQPDFINAVAAAYSPDMPVSPKNIRPLLPEPHRPFAPAYTNIFEPSTSPLPRPVPPVPTGSAQAIADSSEEPILVPYVGPTQSPRPLVSTVPSPLYPTLTPSTTTALGPAVPGSTPLPAGATMLTPSEAAGALPWPPVTDINQQPRGPLLGPPPHESCKPYPTNTMFQHPWSACQVCRCSEYHAAGHFSIEVNCFTKPECCIIPPPTTISVTETPGELQLLDKICEYKSFGVEFPHPRDSCRVCRCQVRGRWVMPTCRPTPDTRCKILGAATSAESTTNFAVSLNLNPGSSVFNERDELYHSNQQYLNNLALLDQQNSVSAISVAQAGAAASVMSPNQNIQQNSPLLNTLQYPTNSQPVYGYQNGNVGTQLYPSNNNQYYTTARLPTSNYYQMGKDGTPDSYIRGAAAAGATSGVTNYLPYVKPSYKPPANGIDNYGYPSYGPTSARAEAMSSTYAAGSNSYPYSASYYSPYAVGAPTVAPERLPLRTTAYSTLRNVWDTTTPSYFPGDTNTEAWAKALATAGDSKLTRSDGGACAYAGDRYHARCQACYCLRDADTRLYAMCLGDPCS